MPGLPQDLRRSILALDVTLSSLSARRHPPLLFPPRKVPRITSSPNRPSEIAREPVHDDGLDTFKG